jgi:hypothetical protein
MRLGITWRFAVFAISGFGLYPVWQFMAAL